MDFLIEYAKEAAQESAAQAFAAYGDDPNLNPGQHMIMNFYVIPAMQDAVRGGARDSEISSAGYDSHYAAEQSLSDLIEDMTDGAEFVLEIVDAADAIDLRSLL